MLTNRIYQVKVRNYRSLSDIEIYLDDLTVLVGVNGSGKSNFLDVFRFVSDALTKGLDAAYRGRNIRSAFSTGQVTEITLNLSIDGQNASYQLELEHQETGKYQIRLEKFVYGEYWLEMGINGQAAATTWEKPIDKLKLQPRTLALPLLGNEPEIAPVFDFLTKLSTYSIFPEALRSPQLAQIDYPLDSKGDNILSVLRRLIQEYPVQAQLLSEALSRIVPSIVEDNPVKIQEAGNYLIALIQHEKALFNLALESDGTLRILGLLTALYQTPALPFISIEEPEMMVHPGAMALLCDVLKEAATHSQIILSTHSPDLISQFDADSLRIVELENGVTQIGNIRTADIDAINEQLFSGGDLLRIGGLQREE